jgi:hypothetical protein
MPRRCGGETLSSMERVRVQRIATGAVLGCGALLFLDLFFDWQRALVDAAVVHVDAGSSGWHGWGVVAGVALAGLLLWEGSRRLQPEPTSTEALGAAAVALLVLGTVVASFQSGVDVTVSVVSVSVGDHTWAAYLGVALASIVAAAAVVRAALVLAATRPTRTDAPRRPQTPAAG